VENYLETMLILEDRRGTLRFLDMAIELEYSKPSVSTAMRRLRKNKKKRKALQSLG